MGAETVSRDELGHKALPSAQKKEKSKINRVRKVESCIPCLLYCKTTGPFFVPYTKEPNFGDSVQVADNVIAVPNQSKRRCGITN